MMNSDLTDEQRLLEQSIREWGAREVSPRIRDLDREHRFDQTLILGGMKRLGLHGANGYSDEYPVGRDYRNCKGAVIYEGTREIYTLMQADYVRGFRQDKPLRCELPKPE